MRQRPHREHVVGLPGPEAGDAGLHDSARDARGAGSGAGGVVRDQAGQGAGAGGEGGEEEGVGSEEEGDVWVG